MKRLFILSFLLLFSCSKTEIEYFADNTLYDLNTVCEKYNMEFEYEVYEKPVEGNKTKLVTGIYEHKKNKISINVFEATRASIVETEFHEFAHKIYRLMIFLLEDNHEIYTSNSELFAEAFAKTFTMSLDDAIQSSKTRLVRVKAYYDIVDIQYDEKFVRASLKAVMTTDLYASLKEYHDSIQTDTTVLDNPELNNLLDSSYIKENTK